MNPAFIDDQQPNQIRIDYQEDQAGTFRLPALEITFSNY